jgi:hypothetical protein
MNKSFLIGPGATKPDGGANLTRRSFIKRTGGAAVGSMVAWNSMQSVALAGRPGSGFTTHSKKKCNQKCGGSDFLHYGWSANPNNNTGALYFIVKQCKCANGHPFENEKYRYNERTDTFPSGLGTISYVQYGNNPPKQHPNNHSIKCSKKI